MKVTTLFENRTISKEYKNNHGLSLYIETQNHKILFDTGRDGAFADNALKLRVHIEDVDIAVLSHGHYDHGGGLETFLKLNNKAKIYIGKGAFDYHLAKLFKIFKHNLGLKKSLAGSSRFVFIDETVRIDDELILFGSVRGDKLMPKGNSRLLKQHDNGRIDKDDFQHEINLLVNEKGRYSLFCGCSHRGIVNILRKAKDITGGDVNTVIGGFHLMGMNEGNSKGFLDELSAILSHNNVDKYYTCHCTGEEAYSYLRKSMKNLGEIKTGSVIEV